MLPDMTRFQSEYEDYNNISAPRRRRRLAALTSFHDSLAGRALTEAGPEDMRAWLSEMVDRGLRAHTVVFHHNLVKPYFAWAYDAELITHEHFFRLSRVPSPRSDYSGVPRPYRRMDIAKLWIQFDAQWPGVLRWEARKRKDYGKNLTNYRFKRWEEGKRGFDTTRPYFIRTQMEAMVSLALYGGLRVGEVMRLTDADLHPDYAYIVVRGAAKNPTASQEPRVVPWTTDSLRGAVDRWLYLRERYEEIEGSPLPMWSNMKFTAPLQLARAYTLLRFGSSWEWHRLRHTAATEMLRAGYPLEHVKEIMGHKNINQTLAYAAVTHDDMIAAAAKAQSAMEQNMSRVRVHEPSL